MRRFIDDTVRDIFYALCTFRRAPLVAFTIVATVAVGLGLVAVAFTLLNLLLFRVDAVPDVHEMFALERPQTATGEQPPFTRTQFDGVRRETNVFSDAFAQVSDVDSLVDGRLMFGTFITGNAFQVLGVRAAMGRALTPEDDEPFAGRAVMVLSDRGWDRLFARDPAIVGRRLLVNKTTFEVIGVMPEGFRGLAAVAPDDYWAPLAMLEHVRPIVRAPEGNPGLEIIGRLKPGVSKQAAVAQLAVWDAGQRKSSDTRGVATIALAPRRGVVEQRREAVVMTAPLFLAFGLILLIACANVANLLLARGVARQREIGIRLSLGATRRRIIRQLLTENLLLALVAAAAALAISRVVLGAIIEAVTTSNLGDIRLLQPGEDWRLVLFLVIGAGVSTMTFGLVPAVQATRIEPVRTIRGEVVRDARPRRARDFLIGLQVSASALLLICAAVFLKSAFVGATYDPGMRISDNVIVQITSEPARSAMVQAVSTEPSITAVAASWPAAIASPRAAFAESAGVKTAIAYRFVSPEYFDVLDIAVVHGRPFTPAERTHYGSVGIVSETTARALWPNRDAVGQVIHLAPDPNGATRPADEPQLSSRTFTVIGVVRDVAGFRIAPFTKAVVYVPTSERLPKTVLVARVHGDPERARQSLLNRLATIDPTIDPNMPGGERQVVGSMEWVARMETSALQLAFSFTVALGVLALALTLSGLFSVLSYLVEQRHKEIGVRMALGATPRDVTQLVLSQSVRPVGLGLVIGAVAAAALAKLLLVAGGVNIGHIVQVLDPIAYAGSLLIIISACLVAASIPTIRAARLNPTMALRRQ